MALPWKALAVLAVLWLSPLAGAAVPELNVAQALRRMSLTAYMNSDRQPAAREVDPEAFWLDASGEPVPPAEEWRTRVGERLVGRIVLVGSRESDVYAIQVPLALVDEVQVWYRIQGGNWRGAVAGDRVALSRWPFAGQFPTFVVPVREEPVETMVMLSNASPLRVPVWIMSDAQLREVHTKQANVAGVVLGLGLMVVVTMFIAAAVTGRRANWLLAAVSVWVLFTIMCLNGYMAVWFTPELPEFNDASKPLAAVVLVALMVALTAESLDQRYMGRAEQVLRVAVPCTTLLYAIVQLLWLPTHWRPIGALVSTFVAVAACLLMCGLSALHGGRYVRWIASAVGCFGLSVLLAYAPFDFIAGIDIRGPAIGVLLFASMLLFHQSLFARERYGRDVLGRAAIAANRDPLTALLSYQGFLQAYDAVLLHQGATHSRSAVMVFLLPEAERCAIDHGFVLTERTLVRLAACLQGVLGNVWSIARLSRSCFACVRSAPLRSSELQALATRVLATCARVTEPPTPVGDFDLRIACTLRDLHDGEPRALLQELEDAAHSLEAPKRIILV